MIRGIRGAVQPRENSKEAIFEATTELLRQLLEKNQITEEMLVSIFITATPDLNADFPAYAVRGNGLTYVPVLCASEIAVPGAMTRVIRILLHAETGLSQQQVTHVYLGETAKLRPDLSKE